MISKIGLRHDTSQARMVVPTNFGGNPFPSLGEKRGQTNKLFPNFSMINWFDGKFSFLFGHLSRISCQFNGNITSMCFSCLIIKHLFHWKSISLIEMIQFFISTFLVDLEQFHALDMKAWRNCPKRFGYF